MSGPRPVPAIQTRPVTGSDSSLNLSTERTTVCKLLMHRGYLKFEVVRCFKQVAHGGKSINLEDLRHFRDLMSKAIGVRGEAFGNLDAEFIRFDFDGVGTLHFTEVYMLAKHRLFVHLKKLGGVPEIEIPTRSLADAGYEMEKDILGKGSQAVARLAVDRAGQERCIKCYKKGTKWISGLTELKEEFETMRRLSCDKIAHTFEIFQDSESFYMVNEVYRGGDLTTLRQRAVEQGVLFNEAYSQLLFQQCLEALALMHKHAMMHCDVKETNIMLKTIDFRSPQIVLIDFGLARAMASDDKGIICGTPGYIPPETWPGGEWFPGGDVFSMGVCILQLMTNKSKDDQWIFSAGCKGYKEIKQATMTREPPLHLMPKQMPGLISLVGRMLQKEMACRPRAPCVLKDTWFQAKPPVASKRFEWLGRLLQRRPAGKVQQIQQTSADEPAPSFFSSVIDDAYFQNFQAVPELPSKA